MSRAWKDGTLVTARQSGKMKARVRGEISDEWVVFKEGSIGRIVGLVKEGRTPTRRLGKKQNVYLVKFSTGVAELAQSYLERLSYGSDIVLSKDQLLVSDPDLSVKETPLELEPGY